MSLWVNFDRFSRHASCRVFPSKKPQWRLAGRSLDATSPREQSRQNRPLFDYLVSPRQQSGRNVYTKRTCSQQVEDEFEFGRLQNRQIGWPDAFEDAAGIDADLAENVGNAGPIAHQKPGPGHISQEIAGGYSIACCERDQLRPSAGEKAVGRHE